MTIDDLAAVAARGQRILEAAGVPPDDARRDASVLARTALNWDAAEWLTRRQQPAPPDFAPRLLESVARRARHEPLAYILGEREFYGRSFVVTRDVLIPRPETEGVVDEALALIRAQTSDVAPRTTHPARRTPNPLTVLDVGTGSGCLAITLALECPDAHIVATDISEPALRIARANARRLGAEDRIDFKHGAYLADFRDPVDLIVANPPYVADPDRATLPAEVVDFEPHEALFAGTDGLDTIRALLPRASAALTGGGHLVMEIGQGQSDAVEALIAATPNLSLIAWSHDLQGILRVAVVRGTG